MTGRIMKSSKWNFLMIFLYKLKTFSLETKKSWSSVKKRESNVKCSTILSSPTHVVALPFIYLFFASFSRAAKSSILWLLRIFKKTCFKFHFMCTLKGKVKLLL